MARDIRNVQFDPNYDKFVLPESVLYEHPYEIIENINDNETLADIYRQNTMGLFDRAIDIPHLDDENDAYNNIVNNYKNEIENLSSAFMNGDQNAERKLKRLADEIYKNKTTGDLSNMAARKTLAIAWMQNNAALQEQDHDRFVQEYDNMKNALLGAKTQDEMIMAASEVIPTRPDFDMGKSLKEANQNKASTLKYDANGNIIKYEASADTQSVQDITNAAFKDDLPYLTRKYGPDVDHVFEYDNKTGKMFLNPRITDPKDIMYYGPISKAFAKEILMSESNLVHAKSKSDSEKGNENVTTTTTTSGVGNSGTIDTVNLRMNQRDFSMADANYNWNNGWIDGQIAHKNAEKRFDDLKDYKWASNEILKNDEFRSLVVGNPNPSVSDIEKAITEFVKKNLPQYAIGKFSLFGIEFEGVEDGIWLKGQNFNQAKKVRPTHNLGEIVCEFLKEKKVPVFDIFKKIASQLSNDRNQRIVQCEVPAGLVVNYPNKYSGEANKGQFDQYMKNQIPQCRVIQVMKNLDDPDNPTHGRYGRNQYLKPEEAETIKFDTMTCFGIDRAGGHFFFQAENAAGKPCEFIVVCKDNDQLRAMCSAITEYMPQGSETQMVAENPDMINEMYYINSIMYDELNDIEDDEDYRRGKKKIVALDKDFQKMMGLDFSSFTYNGKSGTYYYVFNDDADPDKRYSLYFSSSKDKLTPANLSSKAERVDSYNNQLALVTFIDNMGKKGDNNVIYNGTSSEKTDFKTELARSLGTTTEKLDNPETRIGDFSGNIIQATLYAAYKAQKSQHDDQGKYNDNIIDMLKDMPGFNENMLNTSKTGTYDLDDTGANFKKLTQSLDYDKLYPVAIYTGKKDENPDQMIIVKQQTNSGKTFVQLIGVNSAGLRYECLNPDNKYSTLYDKGFRKIQILAF